MTNPPPSSPALSLPRRPRLQMLSNMRYHTSVIISLFGALGTLGSSSRKLMKLSAYADRIQEMSGVMREIKAGGATGRLVGWGKGWVSCMQTAAP